MAGNIVISQINGGPIGVINAIINGNFQVNQRGASGTVTLASGAYGHDRWKAGASGCTYTFSTVNNVTTLTISSGSLIQVIEGLNLFDGTYTLSWSGTAQGKIGAGSYAGSGVTGSVVGGTNLNIEFGTGTLSFVQLQQGSVATPFERRDYGRELIMCQRYAYNITGLGGYQLIGPAFAIDGSTYFTPLPLPVQMRAAPSVSTNGGTVFANESADFTPSFNPAWVGGNVVQLYYQNKGTPPTYGALRGGRSGSITNILFSAEL